MNFNIIIDAATTATPTAPQGAGSGLISFLPLILIIVVCYFLMIRPQQKRQKELNKMREALKAGDRVVTTSGLMAKVHEVKDNYVALEIQSGVIAKFDKAAIMTVENANSDKK